MARRSPQALHTKQLGSARADARCSKDGAPRRAKNVERTLARAGCWRRSRGSSLAPWGWRASA